MTHAHSEDETDLDRIAAARPNMKFATMPAQAHERDIFEVANQLEGYIDSSTPDRLTEFLLREGKEAAKLAEEIIRLRSTLHGQQSEAVAWRYRGHFNGKALPWQMTDQQWLADRQRDRDEEVEPLYTHPLPTEAAPVAVSVKPLQWTDGVARTRFGSAYAVHQQADGMFIAVGCGSFVGGTHPTREAAKAAARADYEARIRSAIIPAAKPAGVAEPFGLSAEQVETLRSNGLKPEEIAGDQRIQARRAKELLHWFVRLARDSANPKWTRSHAFELAYYLATTDDRAPFDIAAVERASWLKGLQEPAEVRDMAVRHGWIPAALSGIATDGEAGFVEFINSDVPYIIREIDGHVAILTDMETRQVIGYRVYDRTLPASKEAEADRPVHEWLPTYGKVKIKDLGRDVNDATYAKRDDFDFGDSYPGHVILPTMNFNSLNRIVSKYAERAHPTPTTTGVSEAMVERAWNAYWADEFFGLPQDHNKRMRAALDAALTAPAGDGVPGMVLVPGTLRVCPMRDAICPHGLNCPYADSYDCKPGWESRPAASVGGAK